MLSFLMSHFSCCPLIWMFCSKKSTKKINAVHERSLNIILNDYKSPYPLLLEEVHHITFYQQCINSLMTEVYKYLNGHWPCIVNDILKLRENMQNIWNFYIFQTEKPHSLSNELDVIPYRASQLWQQVPIDVREAAFLALFSKIALRLGNVKIAHVDLAKCLFKMLGMSDTGPLVTDCYISVNWSIFMWGIYAYINVL